MGTNNRSRRGILARVISNQEIERLSFVFLEEAGDRGGGARGRMAQLVAL